MNLRRKRIEGSKAVRIIDEGGEDIGHASPALSGAVIYPDEKALEIVQSVNNRDRMRDALDKAGEEIERLRGKPFPLKTTDLRPITRRSDTCLTKVLLRRSWEDRQFEWLMMGEAHLSGRQGGNQNWTLKAYLTSGVTDFEHDSAYALQLPLIGVELDSVYYHSTHIVGYVDPELDKNSFRVPVPDYNPMKHEDAVECKECEKPHVVVPEGLYCPPFNWGLFNAVRGKRVEIHIGPVLPKDEDDE